jgi:hypothetical protein
VVPIPGAQQSQQKIQHKIVVIEGTAVAHPDGTAFFVDATAYSQRTGVSKYRQQP